MKRSKFFQGAVIRVLVLLLAAPTPVFSQDAQGGSKKFSQQQLDQMMAPIALYPDSLLAQILMAATYPLEVVMADRWVKQNRDLQGDQLNDALDDRTWGASVKALVPFPDVLSMMSEKLDWTQMVGDAFLAQESDVMDTVQQLRRKAYAAANLKSSEKQQVTVENDSIRIEPSNPEIVYVPAYDPSWVYGPWWWPGYPPYFIYPYWPGVIITPGFIAFGVGCSATLVSSGDNVQDRRRREQFLKAYKEKNRLEPDSSRSVKLFIGNDDWPFPFPIVNVKQNWRFDTQAGKEELFCRRIGANELNAIQVCLAITDAQDDYADLMNVTNGQPEYAQKFESSKGKKDGLYWEASPGYTPSPLGPLVAHARAEGYRDAVGKSVPYHGYLYRILTDQGDNANGGAHSYVIGGKMIGGFAVVAFPAVYGSTGIHTFIINHEGVVYRKDLGRDTAEIAMAVTAFNPDTTWKKVE